MSELQLERSSSSLRIRTRAAGMLARLAHDLELTATGISARVRLDGEAWSAEMKVPVAEIRVAGTLRGDRLDASALSASDRREIERRLREDVLRGTDVVTVRASSSTRARADVRVELAARSVEASVRLASREAGGGSLSVSGGCQLSLSALGVREIKGPLGAFKVRDEVEILFDLTLRPSGS